MSFNVILFEVQAAIKGRLKSPCRIAPVCRDFSQRAFSVYEPGRVLSEEERAKEAAYIKKWEAEKLERMRKAGQLAPQQQGESQKPNAASSDDRGSDQQHKEQQ